MEAKSLCLLCLQSKKLRNSHVIPAFVGRYFKETSITGRLRGLESPNLPRQDIHKSHLFCEDCEQLIGEDDRHFVENIFNPVQKEGVSCIDYDFHLGRFCTMQSFRVMAYIDRALNDLYIYSNGINELIRNAYENLRLIVLNRSCTQDIYPNYMIIFDIIEGFGDRVPDPPDHINKYLVRTIDFDIVTDDKELIFIYSKMCKIAIMTFINPRFPEGLESARIFERGTYSIQQEIALPGFADFLFERASHYDSYFKGLSSKQAEAIRDRIDKMGQNTINSEIQSASLADKVIRYLKRKRKS